MKFSNPTSPLLLRKRETEKRLCFMTYKERLVACILVVIGDSTVLVPFHGVINEVAQNNVASIYQLDYVTGM